MSKFRFDLLKQRLKKAEQRTLDQMARTAVIHFRDDNFKSTSFDGVLWKPRKDKKRHPLLQKTRTMRGSIRLLGKSTNRRVVGTTIRYAKYHNDGTRHLPRRRFIGHTKELSIRFKYIVSTNFNRYFR